MEFVMMGLAHLQFRHPIEDFARIEIAEDSPFKLEQKRRVNRVTQIEQRIRPGQAIAQLGEGHSHATHLPKFVSIRSGRLIQETISKTVLSEASLKTCDAGSICGRIIRRGK